MPNHHASMILKWPLSYNESVTSFFLVIILTPKEIHLCSYVSEPMELEFDDLDLDCFRCLTMRFYKT